MGNTNLCVNDGNKMSGFDKQMQTSVGVGPNSRPSRSIIVNQVYQRLITETPLSYSVQGKLGQYQAIRVTVCGEEGVYLGQMNESRPHGPGQLYFVNGTFLEGQFSSGEIECTDGVLIEASGNYYRGGFKQSSQTGQGVLRTSTGSAQGLFAAGRLSGKGKMDYEDGNTYSGQFEAGRLEGKGEMTYKNGQLFVGYFREGKRCGIGHLKTTLYDYFGPFWEDMKEGKGTVLLGKGGKFEGWFERDKLCGYGELHKEGGQVQRKNYLGEDIEMLLK